MPAASHCSTVQDCCRNSALALRLCGRSAVSEGWQQPATMLSAQAS
jgi:hypothetical protein